MGCNESNTYKASADIQECYLLISINPYINTIWIKALSTWRFQCSFRYYLELLNRNKHHQIIMKSLNSLCPTKYLPLWTIIVHLLKIRPFRLMPESVCYLALDLSRLFKKILPSLLASTSYLFPSFFSTWELHQRSPYTLELCSVLI